VLVTLEQSIDIYARATRTWFGTEAVSKTQERIDHFRETGDAEGLEVHEQVKRHILELDRRVASLPPIDDNRLWH
jgi:hypothetical protein